MVYVFKISSKFILFYKVFLVKLESKFKILANIDKKIIPSKIWKMLKNIKLEQKWDAQSQLTLLIISSFAFAILLYLSIFGLAGQFGNLIGSFLTGFLGRAAVILPLMIFLFGIILIQLQRKKEIKTETNARVGWAIFLVFLVFCGVLSLLYGVQNPSQSFNGGGIIGYLIYPYFLGFFGPIGGVLLLFSLFFYGFFLLTGMNFGDFVDNLFATQKDPKNFWQFVPDIFVIGENLKEKKDENSKTESKEKKPPKAVENLTSIQTKLDPKVKLNTQNTEYSAFETPSVIADQIEQKIAQKKANEIEMEREKTFQHFAKINGEIDENDELKGKKWEMETEKIVNPETLDFMKNINLATEKNDLQNSINLTKRQENQNLEENWENNQNEIENNLEDLQPETNLKTDVQNSDLGQMLAKNLAFYNSQNPHKLTASELLEKILSDQKFRQNVTKLPANSNNNSPNSNVDQVPNSVSGGFGPGSASTTSKVNTNIEISDKKIDGPIKWTLPPFELLGENKIKAEIGGDVQTNQDIIQNTLKNFGISVEMGSSVIGPTVTQYTLKPASGVKLSSINSLQKDLTLALAATSIRMEMPISGQSWVGVQIPNKVRSQVRLRDILHTNEFFTFPDSLPVAVGKDVSGANMIFSITKMPHLLVAGSTGAGKSVWINSMLLSLLYRYSPADLQLILVDMKRVELKLYDKIPHLLSDVITDAEKAINALKWTVMEMDRRYKLLEKYGKRNIGDYNSFVAEINEKVAKSPEKFEKLEMLPYMVFVIDELGDLMMLAKNEVEPITVRLTQMSRAVGIHLVLGTQRPDVQVVTGLIKANIPTRICFAVVTQIDSRVVLGVQGAENLVGQGDGLILTPSVMQPIRFQGAFVEEKEVRECCQYIKIQAAKNGGFSNLRPEVTEPPVVFVGVPGLARSSKKTVSKPVSDGLFLYEEARKMVLQYGQCSAEFLMEVLTIDKKIARKILTELEEDGVIGPEQPDNRERDIYAVD